MLLDDVIKLHPCPLGHRIECRHVPMSDNESRRAMAGSSIHDGSKIQTCAPFQIKFVRDRKNPEGEIVPHGVV